MRPSPGLDAAPGFIDTAGMEFERATRVIATVSHDLHARGWVPATSGNFSLRLDDGDIAITASGRDKGRLSTGDVLRVTLDGRPQGDQRPSAETELHLQLYRRDPGIGAVLHTHSVTSVVMSMREPSGPVFEGLEILKAFPGVVTHETRLRVPVFSNSQDVAALAAEVERHMREHGQGHAYLIAGHGMYTWGDSIETCMRQLEALEYLFEYHRLRNPCEVEGSAAR